MIVLDATTKAVEVVLSAAKGANDMGASASYADTSAITFTPGSSQASTNGTSVVTLVTAPASGYQRVVKALTVYNQDTSSNTVTVRINSNGTLYNQTVVNLAVGDTLEYSETFGWKVLATTGYIKNSAGLTSVLGTANQVTLTTASGVATASLPSTLTVPGTLQTTGIFCTPDGTASAPSDTFTSEQSLGFYRSGASAIAQSYGQLLSGDGTASLPPDAYLSEKSLGFYRSANSIQRLSYGTLDASAGGFLFKNLAMTTATSSTTTSFSGTTAKVADGTLYFSVLSLTTNGAEFGFRSGRTVYRFASVGAG